jgi:L-aminopeptidase/D-esterase-like protein
MRPLANRTLTAVSGITVGQAQDRQAATGCTAILGPFAAAADVRGLATGSRELDALSPLHAVERCDGLLLTGGSAFGLAAADGVIRWLEERGRGFQTSAGAIPIVPTAVIFDLGHGRADRRPDAEMGYAAAAGADDSPVAEGPHGAGAGATVGKLLGQEHSEPGGVGCWAERYEDGVVAALAVVNAFGDIRDGSGRIVAGCRAESGGFVDTAAKLRAGGLSGSFGTLRPAENTTLGVVALDAPVSRYGLQVVARQAMNALVRHVSPANTPFDGDIVFALSTGGRSTKEGPSRVSPAELLTLALRAESALATAIERAVSRERK